MTDPSTEQANKRIADNRLIAEFMRWIHHEDKDYDAYEMSNLKYHSSWDELMPVVEKIESMGFKVIISTYDTRIEYIRRYTGNPSFDAEVGNGLEDEKIEATYDAVLQFIQWHNQNKTA